MRASSDGTSLETVYAYQGGPSDLYVQAIDIHPTDRKLYWYAQPVGGNAVVMRSDLDGTNVEPVITGGLGTAIYGIAVDWVNGRLYMHQHKGANSNSSVYTANLDGTGLTKLPFTAYYATDMEFDFAAGKLYFHDNVFYQGIRRSNLDGTNVENLVFGDARGVGLALDLVDEKLYYTDAATRQIFRSDLDGSDQELLATLDHIPLDIELLGEQMFWTSRYAVYRANRDATGLQQLVALNGIGSSNSLAILVPEPSGISLAGMALAMLVVAGMMRRRRVVSARQ